MRTTRAGTHSSVMTSLTTPVRPRSVRHVRLVPAVGAWGFGLAVFYAVFVRFYQGAGGTAGLGGSVPADPAGLQSASYQAGVLILVGGVACLYLASPAVRHFPFWVPVLGGRPIRARVLAPLCATPSLLGGLYAIIHGLSGLVTSALSLAGVAEVAIPAGAWVSYDRTALDVWGLVLYEPWFLAMGLCLVLCVRRYARDLGVREQLVRQIARVSVVLVAAGTAATVWMMLKDHGFVVG